MVWFIIGGIVVIIVAFLGWRITSVGRGARKRDSQILLVLQPIANRLSKGQEISGEEIATIGEVHQHRGMLYCMLKHFEKIDLVPDFWRASEMQATAQLSCWMMHPNELQDPPQEIEVVSRHQRTMDGEELAFFVMRYKMHPSHWAGGDWILGVAGPYGKGDPPYEGRAGAFSRCDDIYGQMQPDELVDWYIQMCAPGAIDD